MIVCNGEHRFIIAEELKQIGVTPHSIVLEPVGRNTAPAVAAAALMLAEEDAETLMLVLPSDHTIADEAAFRSAVDSAAAAAGNGRLITFGIKPTTAETGYGYIHRGAPLKDHAGCFEVAKFVEKPDAATAARYFSAGDYDWNSGMFLFSPASYLEELERLEPKMLDACRAAITGAEKDLDFLRLAGEAFRRSPSRSIDYAVMEHTQRAVVVPAEMGWSDIGSWKALWDIGARDGSGNVLVGDVEAIDSTDSYLRSETRLLAAIGVRDLIVVATDDVVLVLPKDRAQDVRMLVEALRSRNRPEADMHPRVYRPWGYYQTVHAGDRFQVKRITVNVGASLSLQLHHHRAEHWIVANGAARVTRGEDVFMLNENESTYIPPNTRHRLENPGKVPLNLIEVQSGSYLGEDDIVRFEDDYGRG
jgi:mannose-1-phosphate guanylyltransferase/mannose-1-phosphate guanylyltransferase/mannose-6-phosphate isomerase